MHVRDPHYTHTGDAIYEEALIYQEMGDKFSNPDFYKTAAKRFRLLITDYPGNQNCPDALLRLGNIYERKIKDETAAQDAYRLLKKQYKYSAAARQLEQSKTVSTSAPEPLKPALPEAAGANSSCAVQNIRYWSTPEYARVTIDLDSEAKYLGARLSHPERIYFDISKAKLGADLRLKSISVDDDLLKQIRIAHKDEDTVRVVLDLAERRDYSVSELHNPFRIVIDVFRRESPDRASKLPAAEPQKQAAALISKAAPSPVEQKPEGPPRAITDIRPPSAKKDSQASLPFPASTDKSQPPAASKNADKQAAVYPPSGTEKRAPSNPVMDAKVVLPATVVGDSPPNAPKPALPPPSTATVKDKNDARKADDKNPAPISGNPGPAKLTSQGERTLTRTLGLKIGRIVIDPGHGGHDLGTVGPGGFYEKDLVLSIARELRTLLMEKLGAEVILTRNDDTFVPLEERTAIANQYRADLFISIHANSSRISSTSGVETYYLDFAKTDAEREIAARENATAASSVHELEDLIKKIAQADKSAESRELALHVQKSLYSGSRKVIPSTQNRGVRSAPFIVLIGANMPSVLAEVAFISNPKVEKLLKRESSQDRLVKALYSGIEDYMKTLGSEFVQNQIRVK